MQQQFDTPMQMVNQVCDRLMADHFGLAAEKSPAVKRQPHRYGATIDLRDLDVDVIALWEPGFPGDQETEEEPAFWDIHAVFVEGTTINITALVSKEQLQRIREQIEDQ